MTIPRGVAAVLLCACAAEPTPAPPPPVIVTATVSANPTNVLAALVDADVRDADSIAVAYRLASDSAGSDSVAPAVTGVQGVARLAAFGLQPSSAYRLRVRAWGPGGVALSEPLAFITDTLPSDLPRFSAGGSDPSPGYVAFGAGRYGLVIDNTGRVVWYHRFPLGPGLSFQAEPDGTWVTRPTTPDPTDLEPWVVIDPQGNQVGALGCADGLQSRPHDLLVQPDSSYWILCDDARVLDLTALGGSATARVTGTAVQHIRADGSVLFRWTPFGHLPFSDLDSAAVATVNVNWTHGNAVDLDGDGNVILSYRNLGEILKIDVGTGAVLWELGGRRSAFAIAGAPTPPFVGQHGLRALGNGELLLLDNVGDPQASRAKRFHVDATAMTAQLEQVFASLPNVVTQIGGSVQGLPGGRALVSFGTAGRVEEYDAAGNVAWRINGNAGYVFRAQRITSLYRPGVGNGR